MATTNQPYDVKIVDNTNSVEIGLKLATDEGGNLSFQSTLGEPIRAGISQGALSEADVPPEQELVFNQNDWSGGVGEFEATGTETDRSHFAAGVDTRFAGKAFLGPGISNIGATSSQNEMGANPDTIYPFIKTFIDAQLAGVTYLFCVVSDGSSIPPNFDTALYRFNSAGYWELAENIISLQPLSAACFDDKLHIIGLIADGKYSTNYNTATAANITVANNLGLPLNRDGFLVSSRNLLVMIDSVGKVYTCKDDPTVAANWSSSTPVGDKASKVNNVTAYDDSVIIAKNDGIFGVDINGESIELLPRRITGFHGRSLAGIGSNLYASLQGGGLWKYNLQSGWENLVDSSVLENTPFLYGDAIAVCEAGGQVWFLTRDPTYSVANGSGLVVNRFVLMVYNPTDGTLHAVSHYYCTVSSTMYSGAFGINYIQGMHFTYVGSQAYMFLPMSAGDVTTGTSVGRRKSAQIAFPKEAQDPLVGTDRVSTALTFNTFLDHNVLETPWVHFGYGGLTKEMLRLQTKAYNTAATNIAVYYVMDNNATSSAIPESVTGWTLLGTLNTVGNTDTTTSFPKGITGKRIKLKFVFETTSSSVTPILYQYTLFASGNFERRRIAQFTAISASGTSNQSGRTKMLNAAATRDALNTARRTAKTITLYEPDGSSWYGRIISMDKIYKTISKSTSGPSTNAVEVLYNIAVLEAIYD